jgi:putative transcriptional regulator
MSGKAVKYEGCGLPNVFLLNGCEKKETPYGPTVSIANVEGLHRAIADVLVDKAAPLSGAEFRFLRKLLDMSQKVCGEMFDVDPQTIAIWEKDNKVDKRAEALLRTIVRQDLGGDVVVRQLIQRINEHDRRARVQRLTFTPTANGWKLQRSA